MAVLIEDLLLLLIISIEDNLVREGTDKQSSEAFTFESLVTDLRCFNKGSSDMIGFERVALAGLKFPGSNFYK